MNSWDVVLIVAAAFVAVTALVRLMVRRRDQMLGEFRQQMEREKKRKGAEAKKDSRQEVP